jgi:hypothetical protein
MKTFTDVKYIGFVTNYEYYCLDQMYLMNLIISITPRQ